MNNYTPKPIHIDTDYLRGDLYVTIEHEFKQVLFRFCFTDGQNAGPVFIRFIALNVEYHCCLDRREPGAAVVLGRAPLKEDLEGKQLFILSVEPGALMKEPDKNFASILDKSTDAGYNGTIGE
jgi:hypothetical protein